MLQLALGVLARSCRQIESTEHTLSQARMGRCMEMYVEEMSLENMSAEYCNLKSAQEMLMRATIVSCTSRGSVREKKE